MKDEGSRDYITPIKIRILARIAKYLGVQFKIDGIPYGALPKHGARYIGAHESSSGKIAIS